MKDPMWHSSVQSMVLRALSLVRPMVRSPWSSVGQRTKDLGRTKDQGPRTQDASIDRREFLATVAAAQGVFVLGFWVPSRAEAQTTPAAAWYEDPATREINAWIVIAPDDTVTIRIAQTELGQGVWTSNAMMVAEELQCDWSKVRAEYASAYGTSPP